MDILTSNIPQAVPYLAFVLFKIPLPLTVIQILAVDLGTDMLPALGLGTEKPHPGIMQKPPRARGERLLNGAFRNGARNVRVRYTAGYATVPDDLAQACMILAASWFNAGHQGGDGMKGETLGDYRADYAHQPLPEEVMRLLVPYRNWDV